MTDESFFSPRVEKIILPNFILKEKKPGNLSGKNLEHPFLSVCGSSGNTAIASAACTTPGELQEKVFSSKELDAPEETS